jgi:hypothetical protein
VSSRYNVLFLGTNSGSVRVYTWPFTNLNVSYLDFIEFPIHSAPVSSLAITNDNQFLMSGAEDGSVYFSRLLEYVEGGEVNSVDAFKEGGSSDFILNNIILTSKISIENKHSLTKELIFKIESLKSEIDDHKEKINNECAQKIKTVEEKNRDSY